MKPTARAVFQRAIAAALFIAVVHVPTSATEERPLPAFTIVRPDGQMVDSSQISSVKQYVLMYLAPGCRPCDHLLALLDDSEAPLVATRIVVIVGGDPDVAAKYMHDRVPPRVTNVTWFADPMREAFNALRLTGVPILMGVRQSRLMWSVSGVLNDGSTVQSVVRSWVNY